MGLEKRPYNHEASSVSEGSGYSMETISRELIPRALSLGREIVTTARRCPTMVVEAMLGSPIFEDAALDNRDRAMILILSGSMVANRLSDLSGQGVRAAKTGDQVSSYGYDHQARTLTAVFHVSDSELAALNRYIADKVFGRVYKTSQLVENLENMLGDATLTPFQKAFIEALVSQHMTERVAEEIGQARER